MDVAKHVANFLWRAAWFVIPLIYCLNGSNDPGSRAVAGSILILVFMWMRNEDADKKIDLLVRRQQEILAHVESLRIEASSQNRRIEDLQEQLERSGGLTQ